MTAGEVQGKLRDLLDLDSLRGLFPGAIVDQLRRAFKLLLDSLDVDNLSEAQRQAIYSACKWSFDTIVRPYNIPLIPETPEKMLEDWAWLACDHYLRGRLKIV